MTEQELISCLKALGKADLPPEDVLERQWVRISARIFSMPPASAPRGFSAWAASFVRLHMASHALPLAGGIALVLSITAGTGLASLHATPQHRLLYQIRSSVQGVNLALHPAEQRPGMEVALLAQGARDLAAVPREAYSPAEVETMIAVIEGRFARVAGHLQRVTNENPEYPFVLLIDTAKSADNTEKALAVLQQTVPTSLQSKLMGARSTVAKTKRAALNVMVTFNAEDPETKLMVKNIVGEELQSMQETIGSLLVSDADLARVNAAGDVLVIAEQELREGNFKVTLSLINEAEDLVSEDLAAQSSGVVEGEAVAADHAFSTSTSPQNDTSTDVIIGTTTEVQEESGNSESEATTTMPRFIQKRQEPKVEKPAEPEEFPIGFDL